MRWARPSCSGLEFFLLYKKWAISEILSLPESRGLCRLYYPVRFFGGGREGTISKKVGSASDALRRACSWAVPG